MGKSLSFNYKFRKLKMEAYKRVYIIIWFGKVINQCITANKGSPSLHCIIVNFFLVTKSSNWSWQVCRLEFCQVKGHWTLIKLKEMKHTVRFEIRLHTGTLFDFTFSAPLAFKMASGISIPATFGRLGTKANKHFPTSSIKYPTDTTNKGGKDDTVPQLPAFIDNFSTKLYMWTTHVFTRCPTVDRPIVENFKFSLHRSPTFSNW